MTKQSKTERENNMRKIIALLLACVMLLCLTACGEGQTDNTTAPDNGGDNTTAPDNGGAETTAPNGGEDTVQDPFSFTFSGVELVPGADFDPSVLPEASYLYQVPSCAIEGTDNVYNYETFEITAFADSTGEVIYSIYLIDANTPTGEGLYLGDDVSTVESIYGTDHTVSGTEWIYTRGDTMLVIIINNDFVASVEYRMVTE